MQPLTKLRIAYGHRRDQHLTYMLTRGEVADQLIALSIHVAQPYVNHQQHNTAIIPSNSSNRPNRKSTTR